MFGASGEEDVPVAVAPEGELGGRGRRRSLRRRRHEHHHRAATLSAGSGGVATTTPDDKGMKKSDGIEVRRVYMYI